MAQQARPKVIGHILDSRAQLMACSSVVVTKFSSERPSSQPMSTTPTAGQPLLANGANQLFSLGGRHRRLNTGSACLLCERTPYPVQVSSFPQVSETDEENTEKDQ